MKKKGFTLIELLAVIVILAIIALIATPTILGVIEKAKKGAAESSTLNYIDAVEKYMVLHELDSNKYPYNLEKGKTYYVVEDSSFLYDDKFSLIGKVYAEGEQENIYLSDFITIKGDAPTDGYVVIGEKNTIARAKFVINNYEVTCESNDKCEVVNKNNSNSISVESITINDKTNNSVGVNETLSLSVTILPEDATNSKIKWSSSDESIATVDINGIVTGKTPGTVTISALADKKTDSIVIKVNKIYADGEIVYFNPTIGEKCNNYVEQNSNFGNVDGCLKFYAFLDDRGDNINLILDHNVINSVWSGQTMINSLKSKVSSWDGVDSRSDNYVFNNGNISYTLDYSGSKARIIEAEEVKEITNLTSWESTNTSEHYYFDSNSTVVGACKGGSTSGCNYYWLHERIHKDLSYCCGCTSSTVSDVKTSGYWTSAARGSYVSWQVSAAASLRAYSNTGVDYIGIRPVITIRKEQLM